jgi:hypothetical protein
MRCDRIVAAGRPAAPHTAIFGPVAAGLCCWVLAGCGAAWKTVPAGVVVDPGLVIEAEDGSFKPTGGQAFKPPFVSADCPLRAVATNYAEGEKLGARRVRVRVPGVDPPLHGLLSLCRVHASVQGDAARYYLIRLDPSFIEIAVSGLRTVLYHKSGYQARTPSGSQNVPAWILWLSPSPFAPGAG